MQRSPGGAHQVLKCFNQLDRDHSGAISQDEMRRFLATFHVDVDPRTLHAFVSALDANKDGNIDYEVRTRGDLKISGFTNIDVGVLESAWRAEVVGAFVVGTERSS